MSSSVPIATIVSDIQQDKSIPETHTFPPQPSPGITETYYVETMPENPKLQKCWRYGKTTKMVALIDLFFCALASMVDTPLMLLLIIMPFCGYVGAKKYNLCNTGVYMLYCIMLSVGRVIQLDYILDDKYEYINEYSSNRKTAICVIYGISIVVQIWISWIVLKFYNMLLHLNNEEKNTLLVGTYIPIVREYIFY